MKINYFLKIEEIAKEGAVVVVKIDGARCLSGNHDIYTVVLSGGGLGADSFFRMDGDDIDFLLQSALDFYENGKAG